VEDSNNPTIFVETLKTSTVGGAWEIITFNFANPAPNPSAINFANTYNKLSIFFNFGISGETAGEQTYYFDDVEMGQGGKSAISNVTFRVDMNEVAENFTTPEVNGTFNNWCGNCAPMTDEDGDGVWELVIALEPGMYEYKFSYDAWAGQEMLLPGSSCTMTTGAFTNRVIQVSEDTVLDVVCWASCGACGTNSGPYPVTFQVDMSQYAGAFTTPEVNGNFNNWCGNCAPMTDVNGDNIWEIIIPLSAGNYEYKFSFDGWAGQEALTPGGTCTVTTDAFTNRTLTVSDDVVLTPVCWESCAACIVSTHDLTTAAISVYPNPSNEYLTIAANNNDLGIIQIYSANGQLVFTGKTSIGGNTKISTATWPVGIYHVQVIQNGQVSNFSQIIEH
jgi:hypothetical protein